MAEKTYTIPAIHCEGCAGNISEVLEPIEGVQSTEVDLERKTIRVRGSADDAVVRKVLTAAGYPPA
ncbi:MAG: heavy-metal-associated domain-containing protein [Candidatus Limnocylindria bacterium]